MARAPVPTPTPRHSDLLPGTLDMLVLRTVSLGPLHGYAIAQHIQRSSQDILRVEQGSLYPALERLQRQGWLTSKWARTPTGRRARYYTITASGRAQLQERKAEYGRIATAIARVMARA
ncbi:MAG TPA: PadR family transcriptional regulator [Gemmatimonadales bacterium]|nr:PadR family transcriptional regulator [Gemmatimonadales bacterium]